MRLVSLGETFHQLTGVEQQTFTIAPAAFDVTLLPAEARTPGTPAFREAVNAFLQQAFQGFGGRVTILVDDARIAVTWSDHPATRLVLGRPGAG